MAHDIFISYSSRNQVIADALCAHLEERKMRCWYAPRDIGTGESWAGSIHQAIRASGVLALVFTDDSNASTQVLREINIAATAGIPIVPLRLTQAEPRDDMRYYLSGAHWLDAIDAPLEQAIRQLGDTCEALLRTRAEDRAEAKRRRLQKRRKRVIACCAALAVAAACFAGWLAYRRANRIVEGYLIPQEADNLTFTALSKAEVGDFVSLGRYEQDGDIDNGPEPITWQVIERKTDSLVLLSRYGLDSQPFSTSLSGGAWDVSDIRSWLNSAFCDAAFTETEKARLLASSFLPSPNPRYATDTGSATSDLVRLASADEAAGLDSLVCKATEWANANGVTAYSSRECEWWLSTPGCSCRRAMSITMQGSASSFGTLQDNESCAARPVIEVSAPHRELPTAQPEEPAEGETALDLPVIEFGRYEQDGDLLNGPEPIEWIVLDDDEGTLTLLSRYVLDAHEFHASQRKIDGEVGWPNASIRTWLNGEFLYAAFSEAERAAIVPGDTAPDVNPRYGRSVDETTRDSVWLPGTADLSGDALLIASATPFARWQSPSADTWWLRTQGGEAGRFVCVGPDGTPDYLGETIDSDTYLNYRGIRPMLRYDPSLQAEGSEATASDSPAIEGNTVIFGRWEQDGDLLNGPEPIEWTVLKEEDGRILLLSSALLDSYTFDRASYYRYSTWEVSSLRAWLNGVFRAAAFTPQEQARICLTDIHETEHEIDYDAGNDTQDFVFVLDRTELTALLPNEGQRTAAATTYACDMSNTSKFFYWLRAGGIISQNGEISRFSGVGYKSYVRPALWLDMTEEDQ